MTIKCKKGHESRKPKKNTHGGNGNENKGSDQGTEHKEKGREGRRRERGGKGKGKGKRREREGKGRKGERGCNKSVKKGSMIVELTIDINPGVFL